MPSGICTGVRLDDHMPGVSVLEHVHYTTNEWQITSSLPVCEDTLKMSLLDKLLPGRMGTFLLPKDSVFSLVGEKKTGVKELQEWIGKEQEIASDNRRNVLIQFSLNHLTLAQGDEHRTTDVAAEEEEEEDYAEDRPEEDVDQDDCIENPEQWSEDEDEDDS
jgi:hypothetical protein